MTYKELDPKGIQKSFWKKAYVATNHKGEEILYSYGTPIIKRCSDGTLERLWAGWSNTTGRHIRAFCGLTKAGYLAIPHESTPLEKAMAYSGTLFR